MHMKSKIFYLVFIFLIACSPQIEVPVENPPLEIPYESLNEEIRISAAKVENTNDIIEVKITLIGEHKVLFRPDYQNKIFIYTQGAWKEVFHTPPECKRDNILLSPAESSQFSLYPSLPNLEEATLLRIFFFGNIVETEKRVGAYVDVIINP